MPNRIVRFSKVASIFAILTVTAKGQVLFLEDFEDSTVGYQLTALGGRAIGETSDFEEDSEFGGFDYFGRVAPDGIAIGAEINGVTGSGFFAGNDFDATAAGDPGITEDTAIFTVLGINISGESLFRFSGDFAEDTTNGSVPGWDADTAIRIEGSVDNGAFFNIFAIEAEIPTGINAIARIDTNFDGVGEGTALTNTLTTFNADFMANGSTLDLRITLAEFDTAAEDFAFDNLQVSAVPEPNSALLLSFVCGLATLRRRRS